MVWIGQAYEEQLSGKIELAFFSPMIVCMSDSIGTETLALFVREVSKRGVSVRRIVLKEFFVGLFLGVAGGVPMGLFAYAWFRDLSLAATVAAAMTINGVIAVLVGMFVPIAFSRLGRDPALGTDEITTALSDNLGIVIYLVVATSILFSAS